MNDPDAWRRTCVRVPLAIGRTSALRTEVAALKLKKLLGKLGKPTYNFCIRVLSDLMSETAKKTFGVNP